LCGRTAIAKEYEALSKKLRELAKSLEKADENGKELTQSTRTRGSPSDKATSITPGELCGGSAIPLLYADEDLTGAFRELLRIDDK
ncbi:hypothetical protein AAVH_12098, partial [Aphelenchoides avenae]